MANDNSELRSEPVRVKIDRRFPRDLQSYFVTDLVVQHGPDHFILSFFELWPPLILGETSKEKQEVLEGLTAVEAKCVTRIVVTPAKMREFIRTMTDNLEKYERMLESESGEGDQEE